MPELVSTPGVTWDLESDTAAQEDSCETLQDLEWWLFCGEVQGMFVWEAWGSKGSRFIDLPPAPSSWDTEADGIKEVQSARAIGTTWIFCPAGVQGNQGRDGTSSQRCEQAELRQKAPPQGTAGNLVSCSFEC